MPRGNKILIRTGSAAPSANDFATSEPAWDSAAGKLYVKNAAGSMVEVGAGAAASLATYATTAGFPATGSATVLYLAEDSSKLYQWESPVYVEIGAAGGGFSHAASHAADGSDAIALAASQITSGTLDNARLSSAIATYSKIHQWIHNASATGVDVFPRGEALANQGLQAGIALYTFFTPTETMTVSSITMGTQTIAAAGTTVARMGLYTFNESAGTLALVARTANDTTLFNTIATAFTRNFDTTGGYPASYTLTAGVRYGSAVFVAATTLPNLAGRNTPIGISNLVPRTCGATASATDLAASPGLGNINNHVWARFS